MLGAHVRKQWKLPPGLIDDIILDRFLRGKSERVEDMAVRAHMKECEACEIRLWELDIATTALASGVSDLCERSCTIEEPDVRSVMGSTGFYCCRTCLQGFLHCVPSSEVEQIRRRLPVFPAAAAKAMRTLMSEDVTAAILKPIVRSDGVIAAEVLRVANSALFSPLVPIVTIDLAITYLGVQIVRDVIVAALLRPYLGTPTHKSLWEHSLSVASMAERLAKISGIVPPGEAFIAGLLHDIGQLAIAQWTLHHRQRQTALREHGWPGIVIENTLFGMDHAELGAELLREWSIPPCIVDAVRNHHQPEHAVSDTAALLYLCEYANSQNEDLFSPARIDSSMARVRLQPHDISDTAGNQEWVQLLARAA